MPKFFVDSTYSREKCPNILPDLPTCASDGDFLEGTKTTYNSFAQMDPPLKKYLAQAAAWANAR